MEFKFPFPSLKQLAVLRVCQHLTDNRLGFFQEVDNISNWGDIPNGFLKQRDDLIRKYRYVLDGVPIAPAVKAYVWNVWYGVCDQICRFLHESFKYDKFKCHGMKFYFDSHGRLDEGRVWQRFFEEKLSDAKDSDMRDLFEFACRNHLFPEIDITFKKVIALAGDSQKVEGLQHKVNGIDYMMDYHLPNMSNAFANKISSLIFACHYLKKRLNGFRVLINMYTPFTHPNFEILKVCFSLMTNSSQKERLIQRVIYRSVMERWRARHVLDLLTYLQRTESQGWMSYLEKSFYDQAEPLRYVSMLSFWPFAQFAAPMSRTLSNLLKQWMYYISFRDTVVDGMPADNSVPGFLLLNKSITFWNSMPKNIKKNFAIAYLVSKHKRGKYYLPEAMHILKRESPRTYDMIIAEMHVLISDNN